MLRDPAGIRRVAPLGLPIFSLTSNSFRLASLLIDPSLYNLHISQLTMIISGGFGGRAAMMSENEIRERISRHLAGNESGTDLANGLSSGARSLHHQETAALNLVPA